MEVIVASNAGFCFGVNRAVNKAKDCLENSEKMNQTLYSLGSIIHNEQVINMLEQKGLHVVESIDDIKESGTVIIRAHGVGPKVYEQIKIKQLKLIDATCPYVKKIHDLVKEKSDEGFTIIIIGNKDHPEVIGIKGWCNNDAYVVDNLEDMENLPSIENKICVVAQTTITNEKWNELNNIIKNFFKNVEKFDTICSATVKKQEETLAIAKEVDLMIVIGSKNSSNTIKLFEICSKNCSKTYNIETSDEIPSEEIKKIKKVGITAGASTPDWIIREVVTKMDELNKKDIEISFADAFEDSLITLKSGDIVMGKIIGFNATEVYVDLGFKSDGIIQMDEYSSDPNFDPEKDLKVGEEIKVFVIRVNDVEGTVMLSKRKVDSLKYWEVLDEALKNKTTLEAKVSEITNGGLIAVVYGLKVFIPASQISNRYVKDLKEFLNQTLRIRIIENDRQKRKLIGSQRVILEEERNAGSSEIWNTLEKGKKYSGTVKGFTAFGAFVDIGGVDGLIHLSEMSWEKISHPSEVLNLGDVVDVVVLDFDKEKKRISLTIKDQSANPWNVVAEKYKVDDTIKGKVVRIVPFGVFVEIEKGIDGLVHISQISNSKIGKPGDILSIGQEIEAKIVEINVDSKKIGLSIKDLFPEESENSKEKPQEKSENIEKTEESIDDTEETKEEIIENEETSKEDEKTEESLVDKDIEAEEKNN